MAARGVKRSRWKTSLATYTCWTQRSLRRSGCPTARNGARLFLMRGRWERSRTAIRCFMTWRYCRHIPACSATVIVAAPSCPPRGGVEWGQWTVSPVEKRDGLPFTFSQRFSAGYTICGCADGVRRLRRDASSPAAQQHFRLGCEHMFPERLKGPTLWDEKAIMKKQLLIPLSPYRFNKSHS
ncbi:hypothetical protein F4779DRAFT_317713 [Xylariaceae sp. FL0662B]|nr:hypothetical protein F4779DRAFT_317713 [Xylariaceae sp. FL0662B]